MSVKYLPFDAGGEAMASLLSGEADALSTGLSEAVGLAQQGEVRILVTTAPKAIDDSITQEQGMTQSSLTGAVSSLLRVFLLTRRLHTSRYSATCTKQKSGKKFGPKISGSTSTTSGNDFVKFLEKQKSEIGGLMKELGFL